LITKKKVLITAGPTWVAIDKARVISNIASGKTGFILADKFKSLGIDVTLLLGPGYFLGSIEGIKIIRFKYFSQLETLLKKELKKKIYSAVIHAAAVSDYKPNKIIKSKVDSDRISWRINLIPTKKLINSLGVYRNNLFKVGFKFEPDGNNNKLINEGKALLKRTDLDLVVANSNREGNYCAYILENTIHHGPFFSKVKMASGLVKLMRNKIT